MVLLDIIWHIFVDLLLSLVLFATYTMYYFFKNKERINPNQEAVEAIIADFGHSLMAQTSSRRGGRPVSSTPLVVASNDNESVDNLNYRDYTLVINTLVSKLDSRCKTINVETPKMFKSNNDAHLWLINEFDSIASLYK